MKAEVIAKAVVVNGKGEVLLVRRSKTAPRRPLQWDLPGGIVDEDDSTYAAACVRELFEETGIAVPPHDCVLIRAESAIATQAMTLPPGWHEATPLTWLYYFVQLPAAPHLKLSYEHDKFQWTSLDEAIKLSEYDRQRRTLEYIRDNQLITEAQDENADLETGR